MAGGLAFAITFFADAAAATKREQMLDLGDLAERIETATGPDKASLPWLKMARFGERRSAKGSLRWDGNLEAITGVEADYDGDAEELSFDDAVITLGAYGILCLIYTSPSHTPERPRWRVLCPLAQEHAPGERARFLARLNGLFGGIFANESWTLSQSYYYGSVTRDGVPNPAHQVETLDGIPIDQLEELDEIAIGRPEKPKPAATNGSGHTGPATPPEQITDKRLNGKINSLLANISAAADGAKHHTLWDNGVAIGGYLHLTTEWSDAIAAEACLSALAKCDSEVKSWEGARKTAGEAIAAGRQRPCDLEDRPGFASRKSSRRRSAPPPRPEGWGARTGSQGTSEPDPRARQAAPPDGPGTGSGTSGGGRVPPPGGPGEGADGGAPDDADEQPNPAWNVDTGPNGEGAEAELEEEPPLQEDGGPHARPDEPPQLPVIKCVAGELDRMYRQAEAALLNAPDLAIYQRTTLVRPAELEFDAAPPSGSKKPRKTHSAILLAVTAPAMTKLLSRAAIFFRRDGRIKRGDPWVRCDPPPKLVDIILASRGEWRFPVVRGILTTPTLRPDGSLLTKAGYDPVSRYYLALPSNLVLPEDMPEEPTREQAAESLGRLNALLDGYAFADDEDSKGVSRAVALAILMTQVVRCAMPNSPLLAVSATAPGTGKSHLVDLASHIATGRWCPVMNAGRDDNETEKGINTKLISGVPGFSIDNVHKMLDLEALNTATERPELSPREFGVLKDILVENAATIYMTGNNLAIIDEQVRRTQYCRMDAKMENPEQRAFATDPIDIVLADRGRYVADVLIIARAYHRHGRQPNIPPYGGYGAWSHFVREPLVWLGQPDPLLSQNYMRANDNVAGQRRDIIDAWHQAFGMGAKTLAEAASYATAANTMAHPGQWATSDEVAAWETDRDNRLQLLTALRSAFPAGRDGIDTMRLGHWMKKFAGRVTDGLKFVKDESSRQHGAAWRLSK